MQGAPLGFAAQAGTVLLWHGWMVHTGSTNALAEPRLAVHLGLGRIVALYYCLSTLYQVCSETQCLFYF